MSDLRFHVNYAPWGLSYDFYAVTADRSHIVERVTIETAENDVYHSGPSFSLRDDEARSLMDALWDAGMRPSNGAGSTGELRATEAHLADMRQLVFGAKEAGR